MSKYEIILAVYETKSISNAALKLNYTQSAISQSIKNFEKEIGIQLFKRSNNGMDPMPYTKDIIDCIENVCKFEDKIFEISSSLNKLDKGYIRIGSVQSISYNWLPDILAMFSNAYPNIKFQLTVDGFDELSKKIDNNELDCILASEYSVPNLNFTAIGKDELVLVMPLDHPLCNKLSVSISDIDKNNFILSADGLNYETGKIFKENKIEPKIKYKINEDFTVLKMVEKGFGITILPRLLLKDIPFNVCIRQFNEHYNRVLGIAYSKDVKPSPATLKFMDYVKKWGKL
ncbi:MAG: LysR family transcriptional regulator [Peptostreptococcus sp.]|uniref:LysR family transcriptional regulator n=1 Tax=Peptostreptococcus sp. TaxID=1262 RepID=UPI002FC6B28F